MKDNKSFIWSLFLSGLSVWLLIMGNGTFAAAQEISRVVAVSVGEVNGSVDILSRRDTEKGKGNAQILSQGWKPVGQQLSINPGDQLRTNSGSSLKLNLNDGTIFTLAENSLLTVENMQSARDNQPRTVEFRLVNGTVSTMQTAKTLGLTTQIIRTDNGSVNTSHGEVQITKASDDYPKVAAAIRDGASWPFIAKPLASKTIVLVLRGTVDVQSSGNGEMDTNSMLLPNTCIAQDGVRFSLHSPNENVKISHRPDINGFQILSADAPIQVLIATEGEANKVKLFNGKGNATVGIEGTEIADQPENSSLNLLLNSLLTVDMKASDMTVSLECTQDKFEGFGFKVLQASNGIIVLKEELPGGTKGQRGRGHSTGAMPTPTPIRETPSPTPTPRATAIPGEEVPTPTPTPGGESTVILLEPPSSGEVVQPVQPPLSGELRPTPVPTKIPVTHTYPREPRIEIAPISGSGLHAPKMTVGAPNSCGSGGRQITMEFAFKNYLPQLMPGSLSSFVTDSSWVPIAPAFYGVIQSGAVDVLNYTYTNSTQLETGHIRYWFCYNNFPSLYFYVYIYDREGNQSNRMSCSSPDITVATPTLTCK